ncbi:MAG TPA: arginine deiminase-related protein [Segeticoccus sp.]|uniref:dimethylargininase n=1 Tax=Segeticoccus sp. TaxID=2706531 RepID=UPI002D8084BE|nr:dimethylargininase [Segeticoccus sp.]HET8600636.1 arginine deiminase-related protein [Segeticoccus sp.]
MSVIDPAAPTPAHAPEPGTPQRRPRARRYLMCPPRFFEVGYAINPWMDPGLPVDVAAANAQWEGLRQVYLDLGHEVEVIEPEPGLPDMVFAANGALVIGDRALGASFAHAERRPEAAAHRRKLEGTSGITTFVTPDHVNEGEGDFLVVGNTVLAGTGFRTRPPAHQQVEEVFGLPVISLTLVDPRYYHLDTALAVLDDQTVAYYPEAFDADGKAMLKTMFPDALIATEADAAVLGLNAVSDNYHVLLPTAAVALADQLRERGYQPVPVDLSELLKAGGSVKCCTMELHQHRSRPVAH